MKLVIGGAMHSGTSYAHSVLFRLGLRLSHESVCVKDGSRFTIPDWGLFEGVCAWQVSHLRERPDDALVVHQIRNPLRAIRSMLSSRMHLANNDVFFGTGQIDILSELDMVRHACKCYVSEFRRMERMEPDITHKVECPRWGDILDRLGRPRPTGTEIAEAERQGWRHTKTRANEHVWWDDLSDEVIEIAHAQGYPVPEAAYA